MAWTTPATQTTNTHMTAAIWNEQVTNNLAFLGTNHDHSGDAGDGATITSLLRSGTIGLFDVVCPSGWTGVSAWDGKFLRGSATYNAAAGGAASHTHTTAAHVHTNTGHTHGWNHTHTGPSHTHDQQDSGATTSQATTSHIQTEAATGSPLEGNQMYVRWEGSGGGSGAKKTIASGFAAAGTGNTGAGTGATSNGGTADTGSTAGAAMGSADNLPAYVDVVFCKKD